jgi:hypothetical protein
MLFVDVLREVDRGQHAAVPVGTRLALPRDAEVG